MTDEENPLELAPIEDIIAADEDIRAFDWKGTHEEVLPAPTLQKDADAEWLRWPVPTSTVWLGAGVYYDVSESGRVLSLDIWSDGRANFWLSCWSTRRHRRGAACRYDIWWRYKDSGHPVKTAKPISFYYKFRPKPQPRQERLPLDVSDSSYSAHFEDFQHPNVQTMLKLTTFHHG